MKTHTFAVGESMTPEALADLEEYAEAGKAGAAAMARLKRALDAELAMRELEIMTLWAEESPADQSDCRQVSLRSHELGWRIVAVVVPPRGNDQIIADVVESTFPAAIHSAHLALVAAGELPALTGPKTEVQP